MFYLGFDGGGTKTTVILANTQDDTLWINKKGTRNIAILDRGSTAELIRGIIAELMKGEDFNKLGWATFAFTGAGRPTEKKS